VDKVAKEAHRLILGTTIAAKAAVAPETTATFANVSIAGTAGSAVAFSITIASPIFIAPVLVTPILPLPMVAQPFAHMYEGEGGSHTARIHKNIRHVIDAPTFTPRNRRRLT
jgi:hypothetical protein